METVNDLDGDLMTFWRVLRDRADDLTRVCALTPHARAEQLEAYALGEAPDDLERARRVWVLLTQGRAGVMRNTGWRHYVDPAGSGTSMPGYLEAYVGRLGPAAARLAGVSLECQPALELITRYGKSPKVLLYVDPPYLGSSRRWGNNYRHEMRTEQEHRDLAAVLRACDATVVLSGYDSPLYLALYPDWHATRIDTMTGQGGSRQERTEVLWCNREPQPTLFSLAGEVSA